jgi:regulatory protein
VVARLSALELIDDERFATQYAEDKRRLSGWGSERIERSLIERGIPSQLASAAAGAEANGEIARAEALVSERFADLDDERERQRALGLLARRGFSSDNAYEAIRRARRSVSNRVDEASDGASRR